MDIDNLITRHNELRSENENLKAKSKELQAEISVIRTQLKDYMQSESTNRINSNAGIASLSKSYNYDSDKLRVLFEYIPEERLIEEEIYSPESERTIITSEKWNVSQLKRYIKYLNKPELLEIVSESRALKSETLVMRTRKS